MMVINNKYFVFFYLNCFLNNKYILLLSDNIIGHFKSDLYSKAEIQGETILFSVLIFKYKCYLITDYVIRKC